MAAAKKPMTLRAAVKACDLGAAQAALEKLGDNAQAALDATDGAGRTMLHTIAANANKDDAGELARLLVDHGAGIDAPDLAGKVPLALAVSVGIELPEESSPPALATIRKLLEAKASVDVGDDWRSEDGPLAAAAATPAGDAVCALLQLFGAQLPWLAGEPAAPSPEEADSAPPSASQDFDPPPRIAEPEVSDAGQPPDADQPPDAEPMSTLQADCAEHNIPFATLGSHAEEVLRECVRWQKTSVKELRQECQAKCLSTAGCVEKSDLVTRLRENCVAEAQKKAARAKEADAAAAPSEKVEAEPETQAGDEQVEEEEEDIGDPSETMLEAVDRLDLATVRRALDKVRRTEGESEVEDLVSVFDVDGNTPLHRCVAASSTTDSEAVSVANMEQIADLLINAKADVNEQNLLGESPLLSASRSTCGPGGNAAPSIIRLLLAANADPECADTLNGETSLMEAACRGDVPLCRLLVDAKADVSTANTQGVTALDMAFDNGQANARAFLRSRGASRETMGDIPEGPSEKLAAAVRSGDVDAAMDELEGYGRDVDVALDAIDDNGWTLLHVCAAGAAQDEAGEIARLLIQYEAAVDAEDTFGQAPLVLAVTAGIEDQESSFAVLDVIRVLLVAGASMASMDEWQSDSSALACAASSPSGEAICKLLMAFGMNFPWCNAEPTSPTASASPDSPMGGEPEDSLQARCEEQGVPFDKLDKWEAEGVLRECDRWRGMSVKELRNECKTVHVPTDGCVEKGDLISRLRQVAIWHAMPAAMLTIECVQRGVPTPAGASHDELEDALLVGVYNGTSRTVGVKEQCLAKGIPVDLYESSERAKEVLNMITEMEAKKIADIKKDYSSWGMAIEAGMEKSDMTSRLRSFIIWSALSDSGLQKLCKEKGAAASGSSREDLIKSLAEKGGMPVPTSRHKNFFSYGKEPDKNAGTQSTATEEKKPPKPNRPLTPEEQEKADWEARAEYNRQQFAKGNRNHAGMPGGMRNSGGAAFKTRSGRAPGGQQQRQQAPQRPAAPSAATYFAQLGLQPTATMNEVRKVYRKLALQYHPDKNPGPLKEQAEKKFQEVANAYDKICEHFRLKEGKPNPKE